LAEISGTQPLEPVRHMEVYIEVLKYFQELNMNCHKAIETRPADDVDFKHVGNERNCKIVHISKTTRVSVIGKTVHFINIATGRVVKEVKLTRDAISLHFGHNLLVFVFKNTNTEHVLSIWRVDNSLNLTRLKDVTIGDYDGSLQVDEQVIAVTTGDKTWTAINTVTFISMKTFQVERVLSSRAKYLQYDNGYLFVSKKENLVAILDVASGTFLRDIRIPYFEVDYIIFRVNSKYITHVITNLDSKLYVYDLKCLKETDAAPTHLLLTTIDLECDIGAMVMNETHIICLSGEKMYVVDLKLVDRLRCPEVFH
jgi:hypothetical protein